jgi:hypothetical protein
MLPLPQNGFALQAAPCPSSASPPHQQGHQCGPRGTERFIHSMEIRCPVSRSTLSILWKFSDASTHYSGNCCCAELPTIEKARQYLPHFLLRPSKQPRGQAPAIHERTLRNDRPGECKSGSIQEQSSPTTPSMGWKCLRYGVWQPRFSAHIHSMEIDPSASARTRDCVLHRDPVGQGALAGVHLQTRPDQAFSCKGSKPDRRGCPHSISILQGASLRRLARDETTIVAASLPSWRDLAINQSLPRRRCISILWKSRWHPSHRDHG